MKRLNRLLAIPGMFLLVMVLLITSFQLVIYGDPSYGFYEKEYEKYHVTASLHMSMEDVMEVTEHMMDYLIGKEEKLSIVTDVDGREQDFFNEQDRLHMADVKNLFLGGLKLRTVFLMLAIVLLMLAGVKAGRKRISRQFFEAYSIALGVFLGLLLFLGVAFAIDFTACFTVFHEIFFTNDLWLFDPSVDYMIRMLPEEIPQKIRAHLLPGQIHFYIKCLPEALQRFRYMPSQILHLKYFPHHNGSELLHSPHL